MKSYVGFLIAPGLFLQSGHTVAAGQADGEVGGGRDPHGQQEEDDGGGRQLQNHHDEQETRLHGEGSQLKPSREFPSIGRFQLLWLLFFFSFLNNAMM
jgi:hypothetical protein